MNDNTSKDPIVIDGISFIYDDGDEWYEATITTGGEEIDVKCYDGDNIEDTLRYAVETVSNLQPDELKVVAADELYNKDKDALAGEVSREKYIDNLELDSVIVDPYRVEYWFDCNGMYGDHNVVVTKNRQNDNYSVGVVG